MANEKNDTHQWFLRIAGGTVFGPVSTKGLIVWAEQGRIVPGNEVSNDRETWVASETVPELEMNWYVNAGAKTEGPFNRIAAESFLKSGKAPNGAKLIHAKDVSPELLARRDVAEAVTETPAVTPSAESKPSSPTSRNAAAKATEAKVEADARDRRIAELEATLEKQRETVTLARQAAKTQAALEEERDDLRKQMQEIQAQMESFRANTEKDAQKRERKLDALKQEIARLQEEQSAAKSRPMLELIPEASSQKSDAAARAALEELRRQAEDDRRSLERDAETLRARILELETELARVTAAAEEDRAQAAPLPVIDPELPLLCENLKKEVADAQSENKSLRTKTAKLEKQQTELTRQLALLETECKALADEREKLQLQLGAAMSAATDATNENTQGDLRTRIEQLEAVTEGLRTQLAQSDQALTAERAALTELLAASNERDLANHQRLEELETKLAAQETQLKEQGTPSERETKLLAENATARTRLAELQGRLARLPETITPSATRQAESGSWMRQFATDELTTLDKALHDERSSFNAFRELSSSRQEAIQGRIQALQKQLSGDFAEAHARVTTAGQRISGLDQNRLQSEVESMRETQLKESKQFEDRESELLRRIRVLETEGARLRSLQEATDMEGGKRMELMETIRRREQELAQERRNRDQDREQFQSAQQALLRRAEELERIAGISHDPHPAGDSKDTAAAQPGASRRLANFGNWLKQ